MFGSAVGGFGWGLLQGGANIVNGIQDLGIGLFNLGIFGGYNLGSWIVNQFGGDNPYVGLPSPDWSRGLFTQESGTAGGWDDTHGWSKFLGGSGAAAMASVLGAGSGARNLLASARLVKPATKHSVAIYEKTGSEAAALADFNSLNLSNVKIIVTKSGTTRVGTLPDGTIINIHTSTTPGKTQGLPTLEIRGPEVIKIRYPEK